MKVNFLNIELWLW